MFPLRFHFLIQKARWLNQKCTKVEASAKVIFQDTCGKRKREDPPGRKESRMLSPRQAEEPQALRKQHGALTEPIKKNPPPTRLKRLRNNHQKGFL
jgi:hypothetical protein